MTGGQQTLQHPPAITVPLIHSQHPLLGTPPRRQPPAAPSPVSSLPPT
ncbi:hypothetical protein HEB29_005724 [Streptomyces fulvorobeus]|uniref:Uncharacterized protein n=1 Tax=Streptomyces fulvorobeus TaxID=284028 RepID=A0A7Y9L176_9ACTN|nr:hypothetical protein [Streptomyces fulvorobeus]